MGGPVLPWSSWAGWWGPALPGLHPGLSYRLDRIPQIRVLVFEPRNFGEGLRIQVQRGPQVALIPQTGPCKKTTSGRGHREKHRRARPSEDRGRRGTGAKTPEIMACRAWSEPPRPTRLVGLEQRWAPMPQAPSQVALRLHQRPCSGISGAGVMRGPAAPGALRVLCQQRRVPELHHQACRDPPLSRSGPLPLPGGLAATPQEDFLQVAAERGDTRPPPPILPASPTE